MAQMHFTVTGKDGTKHKETAIVPNRTPNPGTAKIKRRDIRSEVKAKWLANRHHGKSGESMKKFDTSLKHFSVYMKRHEGIIVLEQVKQEHVDRYIEHLKTQPSELWRGKEDKYLSDDNISDLLGDARKILYLVGNNDFLDKTYGVYGLAVSDKDRQNPIDFRETRPQERAELQKFLDGCRCKWAGAISQMTEAFGGRTASAMVSKDLLYVKDGQLYAQQDLSKFQKVTVKALQLRYGITFKQRIIDENGKCRFPDGEKQLICIDEKDKRNGIKAVNTPGREAAIERLQREILSNHKHGKYKSPIPDTKNPEAARESYKKLLQRYGAGRDSQLNVYSDRHWNAQRLFGKCMADGMTIKQAGAVVTIELGHDPKSENYLSYIDISKYK